jgi:alcohol dehydrogenase
MVLGHEAAGEVVEVGEGVTSFSPGDRVVLAFMPSCGECATCLSGRAALCEPGAAANGAGTLLSGERRWSAPVGEDPHHHVGVSAFSEQVVVSEKSAVLIPDEMPYDVAAVFGCAALTGVGAALNAADVQPGETVAVFGLGGVGLSALLGAKLAGAGRLIAVDPVESKRALAIDLGATDTFDGGAQTVSAIIEATAGGANKTIETAGSARVLEAAYGATRRGGTTVTVGLPHPDDELRIKAVSLVADEKTLRGSYLGSGNPSQMLPELFKHWQKGDLPVERLITHRLTLDEINEGFDRLASGEAVRQIVTP